MRGLGSWRRVCGKDERRAGRRVGQWGGGFERNGDVSPIITIALASTTRVHPQGRLCDIETAVRRL
jgi:hypothetical protein